MSKKHFCVNTVIAKTLHNYIQAPDYSELMENINEIHAEDFVELKSDGICPATGNPWLPRYHKVLICTSDTIIVQELGLSRNRTRFRVRMIPAKDWDEFFISWLAPGDEDYISLGLSMWNQGFRMYGADV